ncbi:MAG TPA: hypothetical protein VHN98_01875 [Acidimicrobiales bacterium]|nr:hypothetical protein [Acidimicrobiales bacterium]
MSRRRSRGLRAALAAGATLVLGVAAVPPVVAGAVAATGPAGRAAQWVATQQQPDGGFEVAGFPGFETPDAILAVGAAAQTGGPWSARAALSALLAERSTDGRTPLDYVDDLADGTGGNTAPTAGTAAKLIALVAAPLCLDASHFDPSGDGATDLLAIVDAAAAPDGTYGTFNATLYAAIAYESLGRQVAGATIDSIRGGQQANGGWNYSGDPSGTDVDPDTTGLAVEALVGAGAGPLDGSVQRAESFLAETQDASGGWANPSSFSDVNPNSTALAELSLRAAGVDTSTRTWRDNAASPARTSEPYVAPAEYLASQQQPDGRIATPNDQYGINTFATTQSIEALLRTTLPVVPAAGTCPASGYRMFGADGDVYAFGAAVDAGSLRGIPLNRPIVTAASTPSGRGYLEFASDGGVFAFGDAAFEGSLGDRPLNQPIVAGAVTPTGRGYLLFAADGGVFSFGDAPFAGSLGDRPLNRPIMAGAVTPSGQGYVLFASDGGVFSFGDAPFAGSLGDRPLNSPIVGGDATPSGAGYLMVAADGGVFSFGDAPFLGSLGDLRLNRPIVAGARSSTGRGYALFASDGGVFTFGDVGFAGSMAGRPLASPIVAGAVL